LDDLLSILKQPLQVVFYLNVPEEAILDRLKDRWVHLPSGRVYNAIFHPPKVRGIDDITGEHLTKRTDDNLDAVRARLQQFHKSTLPVLQFYEKDGRLINVDSPTSAIGYVKIKECLSSLK